MTYLRYAPSVEKPAAEEQETFAQLSQVMQHITRTMAGHYRHAYRPVHAKSHGVLVGRMTVNAGLPEALAQGLFSKAGSFPVVLRFSTNPGDLLADSVSSPRGLALKVLNATGEKVPTHAAFDTQDFVCVNAKVFGAPDPAGFLKQVKLFDTTLEYPEALKQTVSTAARGTNALLRAIGVHSGTLDNLGHPYTHILGETFSTIAPIRFGDYVAKIAVAPSSANLKSLTGKHVDAGKGFNALEDLIREFFQTQTAEWEIQAQLALDEEITPLEDASKEWPEQQTPYQPVATITVPPQESYSTARQIFVDEQMSFSPWHALAAHQPLGGIMRSRQAAYEAAQQYRAERNLRPHVEPSSVDEIPG